MEFNILVTGTSSYGVGEGILKIVNSSKYRNVINIISTSDNELSAYKKFAENHYVLPLANQPQYLSEISKIIKNERIQILIPGSEPEMLFFSKNKDKYEKELEVDIWVNKYPIVKMFENKLFAEEFFHRYDINTPKSIINGTGTFPQIIKPLCGKGSEGIFIVYNFKQYQAVCSFYRAMKKEFIVQEYIEKDHEYTVSLINLSDRIEILSMERILNKGATQYARITEDDNIINMANIIHNALDKEELILNLQILEKNKEFYIFEINPRFSGSAPIRAKLGYNEFDILFANRYLNIKHEYKINKNQYCIRGFEEQLYF